MNSFFRKKNMSQKEKNHDEILSGAEILLPTNGKLVENKVTQNLTRIPQQNISQRKQTTYKYKNEIDVREWLLASENRTSYPNILTRAANGVNLGIASSEIMAKVTKINEQKIRKAFHSINEGREIGKRGRPKALNNAMEGELCKWISDEISANRDPTISVTLKKATHIKCEKTGEFLDTNSVQIGYLKRLFNRYPDLTIKAARPIEEVNNNFDFNKIYLF